jgi:hypothetical protein
MMSKNDANMTTAILRQAPSTAPTSTRCADEVSKPLATRSTSAPDPTAEVAFERLDQDPLQSGSVLQMLRQMIESLGRKGREVTTAP